MTKVGAVRLKWVSVGGDVSCCLMTRTASWQAGVQSHTASFLSSRRKGAVESEKCGMNLR